MEKLLRAPPTKLPRPQKALQANHGEGDASNGNAVVLKMRPPQIRVNTVRQGSDRRHPVFVPHSKSGYLLNSSCAGYAISMTSLWAPDSGRSIRRIASRAASSQILKQQLRRTPRHYRGSPGITKFKTRKTSCRGASPGAAVRGYRDSAGAGKAGTLPARRGNHQPCRMRDFRWPRR